jgi:uncharacterized OB-fold protein
MPPDWPLPVLTDWNRPFFTSGVITVQRCTACGTVQHPPMDLCHHCQEGDFEYLAASGTGVVDNFSVVHHAGDARLRPLVPYNVVIIALDDHPHLRIVGNVVDEDWRERLEIGVAVRAVFAHVTDPASGDTLALPQWRLA